MSLSRVFIDFHKSDEQGRLCYDRRLSSRMAILIAI